MDRGEKPDRITVSLPEGAHGFQERFRKRNEAFLIAFADDSKDHPAGIDGFDFQFSGFAGAKTTGIHQGEAKAVSGINDGGKESQNLGMSYGAG
jgi:hypothetical protein